ncbi:LysR substrate-binding domain-containing protein [Paralimibaculum aggregatum]|uniref:LysR substrate-binding domain-containing protein n=1 Tax=Paralimibaculum aggregatum TaxID=3036245 RepID=A0ABQ6LQQ7_9RHOB|nr:LysR substrate-binding domain-containing protein [Limibaculum sp. NKW23]GMG83136.1 LysR substrate-binding domain-containing protein [Limibaculum sp. NKW23]
MSDANRSPFRLDVDLITLRALVAIADTGSFSAAAERIGRTQSAVSLQIAKLEERLQTRLLRRSSRHVSQTPEGELLIGYARRILALADEAATALTAPEAAAPFRVGFADYLAPDHLHALLGRFRQAHPKLVFELRLGTGLMLREALASGALDVAVAGPDGGMGADDGEVLLTEPMVWVAASQGAPQGAPLAEPVPLVLMQPPCSFRRVALEALDRAGLGWRVGTEANAIQAVRSAVQAQLGVSAVARSAAAGMRILGAPLPALPETAMVAYRGPGGHPLTDRFIAFLKDGLAAPGAAALAAE